MAEFRMPSLGADMEAGTLVEWLVAPGDPVHRGDVVAVVETDKSAIEVECFDDGVVGQLLVRPGQRVPVGTPLATIGPAGVPAGVPAALVPTALVPAAPSGAPPVEAAPRPAPVEPVSVPIPPVGVPPAEVPPVGEPVAPAPPGPAEAVPVGPQPVGLPPGASRAPQVTSPLVRRAAERAGVDLAAVVAAAPGRVVRRSDVEPTARPAAVPYPRRARASPLARRLAADAGLDLATVFGTGADGVVHAADVHRAVAGQRPAPPTAATAAAATAAEPAAPAHAPGPPRVAPPAPAGRPLPTLAAPPAEDGMRRAIADLMSRANREIPHYYVTATIDMAAAVGWLRQRNRELPVAERTVPAALLLAATARAAVAVPQLNGTWADGAFCPAASVDLGLVVSLRRGGILVPAIAGADRLSVEQLMAALRDLVERARTGRLRSSTLVPATITVSNLGDQGVDGVLGVVYPPQVALVGFGAVLERPWAVDGLLGVRPVVTATVAADHRATDGAVGARFLRHLDRLLQKPEEL